MISEAVKRAWTWRESEAKWYASISLRVANSVDTWKRGLTRGRETMDMLPDAEILSGFAMYSR